MSVCLCMTHEQAWITEAAVISDLNSNNKMRLLRICEQDEINEDQVDRHWLEPPIGSNDLKFISSAREIYRRCMGYPRTTKMLFWHEFEVHFGHTQHWFFFFRWFFFIKSKIIITLNGTINLTTGIFIAAQESLHLLGSQSATLILNRNFSDVVISPSFFFGAQINTDWKLEARYRLWFLCTRERIILDCCSS